MKVFLLYVTACIALARASYVSPLVRLISPPQTKGFAYSTTQYINTVPYSVGLQPQLVYHNVPQLSVLTHPSYYQIPGVSYIQPTNIFNPTPGVSFVLQQPGYPGSQATGAPPVQQQQQGDADTAVIDSAASTPENQQPQLPSYSKPEQPPAAQPPSSGGFPSYPSQFPTNFPSISQPPQLTGQIPSFPQFPQFPQISLPGFPQFPQTPQAPSNPPSTATSPPSFDGAQNTNVGLSDEDTVSVESA